jgi:enamine deaminase RidA (YjgF/YER057c/UK114 family)
MDLQEISGRLAAERLELPELPEPRFAYVPGVVAGNLVFVSGQTPTVDGDLVVAGRCGAEVDVGRGQEAARLAALNCLAELHAVVGLDRVRRLVKVTGYVASADGFVDQPAVVNGASEFLQRVLGDAGRHARAALGVAWLPAGAPVEIELIAECEPEAPSEAASRPTG